MTLWKHCANRLSPFAALPITLLTLATMALHSNAQALKTPEAHISPVSEKLAKLPLSFEANLGQTDSSVRFLSRGDGYSLFLTDSSAVLALGSPGSCDPKSSKVSASADLCSKTSTWQPDVVRMTLAGASGVNHLKSHGEDELPGKVNYFLGKDPTRWHTDLPTYAKVRYSHVYPGIDLVYYGNQRQLEYDFAVAPGADPAAIRLNFKGEKRMTVAANGDLILEGTRGSATVHKPLIYQEKDSQRQLVSGSFRKISSNSIGFSLGSYDRTRPLIIDPVLVYSTYLGGSGTAGSFGTGVGDQGTGIAVDSTGSAYIVGTTASTNFPVTSGAFQSTNEATSASHGSTAFVTKLNPTGTALVYSTYLGGSGSDNGGDSAYGIALDSSNNAYVTGATYSADFPVTCGALQTASNSAVNNDSSAFVIKLNQTGSMLLYSTYLGGSGYQYVARRGDVAQGIAVDPTGAAYVTGYTSSSNFPVTNDAFQTSNLEPDGYPTAFVSKLNPFGSALVYSTFLGGNGGNAGYGDYGNGIAIDNAGDAYVTGSSGSSNFPTTSGAFQTSLQGQSNAFVTKLNPKGSGEIYATFIGGSSTDSAESIALDSAGFAYVSGNTSSVNFPVTSGTLEGTSVQNDSYFIYNLENTYGSIGFVSKLNPGGTELTYSTYLEGAETTPTSIAVDSAGNTYLTGTTYASNYGVFGGFQATPGAIPPTTSNGFVSFVVKLNATASALEYATLFGASQVDGAGALALNSTGDIYFTGLVTSNNLPVTTGAYQVTNNGNANGASNAFVTKLALASETSQTAYPSPPAGLDLSSMALVSQSFSWYNDGFCDEYFVNVTVNVNTIPSGPPPTGTISFYSNDWEGFYSSGVGGGSGGTTVVYLEGAGLSGDGIGSSGGSVEWQAVYSGDSVYYGSSLSGSVGAPPCTPSQQSLSTSKTRSLLSPIPIVNPTLRAPGLASTLLRLNPSGLMPAQRSVKGPKFVPATAYPASSPRVDGLSSAALTTNSQATSSCIAPTQPQLTVSLHPAQRIYGAANPTFTYSIAGLVSGQTVIVTPQTTATAKSPVGTYPVMATVTGADAANYTIILIGTTLEVTKAPLHIAAKTVNSTYGHTPPQPTAYSLIGFVNGDTASVVTGAPVLTTTVTAATPVGFYQIGVAVGTLSAANYYFENTASGMGVIAVYKAPLTIGASNEAVTYGQTPAPPTAYGLTGFLNGDTASVVSGAPILTTTVTSKTPVGFYQIGVQVGTLSAANYDFETKSNGMGAVGVYRAPLEITVNNLTMTQGGTVPTLTYTLTGFVNGDTAATAVTGAAILSTTATSASAPGNYPITFSKGTLAAKNYAFDGGANGVLKVVP
jgi:hypothetical protein